MTEPIDAEALDWLSTRCRVACCDDSMATFHALLPEADALIVRTYTQVDDALLRAAPRLRVVGRAGVGLDNIDIEACRHRSIEVVHTPDANTQAVVEYVIALMCDAIRPRAALDGAVDGSTWRRLRAEVVGRRQLDECTLGILGLGRIGSRMAQVGQAIGMRTIFRDLREIPVAERAGAEPVEIEALFEAADVLTVHVDGRPENRGFIDATLIDRLRPDVIFINTSRGFVVDHVALGAFLRAHPAAMALLDVHEPEPIEADHPLLSLPNAHLFPHLASRTESAMRRMSWVVRDVATKLGVGEP